MKNTGHHYITKSYQRLFANAKGQVTVLTPEGRLFTTNPENTFKEDHFNTVKMLDGSRTLVVERALGQIEGAYIDVVAKRIHNRQPLRADDKIHVAMFVAAMFNRTKIQREGERQMFQNLKTSMEEWRKQFKTLSPEQRRTLAATPSGGSATISIEELEEGLKEFDSHQAMSVLSGVAGITPKLLAMEWMLLEAPQGKEFMSSDNPLCMCAPAREKKYGAEAFGGRAGLAHADVEVTFPLSRRYALVTTWQRNGGEYEVATPQMVDQINYRSARSANNLFAENSALLEDMLKKFPKSEESENAKS